MRRFVGILALVLALALAAPLAAQDKKSKANDKVKKLASCKVIMVVKLTKVHGISYSGIVGSRFMFEIEKVLKFEADKDIDKSGAAIFNELLKRSGNLGDYKILEYTYEYPSLKGGSGIGPPAPPTEADRKQLKKDEAIHGKLTRLLKKGSKYILAAPSAKAFCSLSGAVMPNKWGSVLLDSKDEIILEKYTKSTLKKIDTLLKKEEKKPSPELKKKIDELIRKLGDEKYKVREKAQKELTKIGKPAAAQLKEATKGKDLEVQRKAKKILTDINLTDPNPTDGLKFILRANKKTLRNGDKLILTLEWKNVGKEDVVVQRKLKKNPLMILEVKGDLDLNIGRWGEVSPEDMKRFDSTPVTIKPGKKLTAKIESGDWCESTYIDKTGQLRKESGFSLVDDKSILGFKQGKYTITAKTRLAGGKEVRSNPVEIEVK